jgi:hypothetical protein
LASAVDTWNQVVLRGRLVAKRKSKGEKSRDEPDFSVEMFADALRASAANPGDDSLWERLEDVTASDRAREQLLELYRAHLSGDLPEPMRELLARRAVRFAGD